MKKKHLQKKEKKDMHAAAGKGLGHVLQDNRPKTLHQQEKKLKHQLKEGKPGSHKNVHVSKFILDKHGFVEFLKERYEDIENARNKYDNQDILKCILKEGVEMKFITDEMNKTKLLEFISEKRNKIWPAEK